MKEALYINEKPVWMCRNHQKGNDKSKVKAKEDTENIFVFRLFFFIVLQRSKRCTRVHIVCVVLYLYVNIDNIFK